MSQQRGLAFKWRDEGGCTVWSPFSEDNDYFEPTNARFMINYRVEDLHAVLEALRSEGVEVDEKTEDSEFGKFGWARDCEGNRFELWQPPEGG